MQFIWPIRSDYRIVYLDADYRTTVIARRKREVVFTGHGKVAAFAGRHAPGLVHAVVAGQQKKKRAKKDDA